jgi:RNA polymerase sigma-70 factor (ECF subfamily)
MPGSAGKHEFVAFYDEFLPQVYRYVRYRVADTATAEDLTATIFEKALRGWGKRRKPDSVAPWVFRIAHNTVISHYRRSKRQREVPLDSVEVENGPAADLDNSPEDQLLRAERWEHIETGIRALSPREQDIIALKFGGGLTNRAIAPVVGTSEGNVAVILHRAMRKLHAYLEGDRVPAATSQKEPTGE